MDPQTKAEFEKLLVCGYAVYCFHSNNHCSIYIDSLSKEIILVLIVMHQIQNGHQSIMAALSALIVPEIIGRWVFIFRL